MTGGEQIAFFERRAEDERSAAQRYRAGTARHRQAARGVADARERSFNREQAGVFDDIQ
jgi:hypothetical protein